MQFTIDAILGNTPSSAPPKAEDTAAAKLPLEEGQDSGRESVCSEVPESPGAGKTRTDQQQLLIREELVEGMRQLATELASLRGMVHAACSSGNTAGLQVELLPLGSGCLACSY